MLLAGDRRMEAESYLSDGFATRLGIQSKAAGWNRLKHYARIWQPSRLKGTQVSPQLGTPFLAATQVFDLRPSPRKWLALEKTSNFEDRFVLPRTILLTCSGTVGRATLAQNALSGVLITHDLLRIEPIEDAYRGWIYAYLRSPSVIRLMQAAHYGHMIKHLEVEHLEAVPVVAPSDEIRTAFNAQVEAIFSYRNEAEMLMRKAEALLSREFRSQEGQPASASTVVPASSIFRGRRRFEATFHSDRVRGVLQQLSAHGREVVPLSDLTHRVWWMTRFSRHFGESGAPYMSADELFSVGQVLDKRVYTALIPNHQDFFVKEGWILMACSGQTYGLNGSVTLATAHEESFFFSHDLIRIAPDVESVRPGYLFAYLGHPDIGQVLVKRTAYGSSIPHLDPGDIADLPIARLPQNIEEEIAEAAERASELRARASEIERQIAADAETILQDFLNHSH